MNAIPESLLTQLHISAQRAVRRYQSMGLEASLGVDEAFRGASLWHVDPRKPEADTYQLDVD